VVPRFRTVEEYGLPQISTPSGAPALDSAAESARASVALEYSLMFPWIEVAGIARAARSPTAGMPIGERDYGWAGQAGTVASFEQPGTDWRIDPSQQRSDAAGFDVSDLRSGEIQDEEFWRQQNDAIYDLMDAANERGSWPLPAVPPFTPPYFSPPYYDDETNDRRHARRRARQRRGRNNCLSRVAQGFVRCNQRVDATWNSGGYATPNEYVAAQYECEVHYDDGRDRCTDRWGSGDPAHEA
jgi:hypothetical protein